MEWVFRAYNIGLRARSDKVSLIDKWYAKEEGDSVDKRVGVLR